MLIKENDLMYSNPVLYRPTVIVVPVPLYTFTVRTTVVLIGDLFIHIFEYFVDIDPSKRKKLLDLDGPEKKNNRTIALLDQFS